MSQVEHRRARRRPVWIPVALHFQARRQVIHGRTRNLCRNGMYVQSIAELPNRGLVEVVIQGPVGDRPVLCAVAHGTGQGIGLEILVDIGHSHALLGAWVRAGDQVGAADEPGRVVA